MDVEIYFLVGIVGSPYLPQILKSKDQLEAFEKYSTIYGLKDEEIKALQVFQKFISENDVERWLENNRNPNKKEPFLIRPRFLLI